MIIFVVLSVILLVITFIFILHFAFNAFQNNETRQIISSIIINLQYDENDKNDEIIIKNPIDETDMIWETSIFTENNWPDLYYELEEKRKIFEFSKQNKFEHGVIDVGAHIGDLAIPLALALSNCGRKDIIVYAIDPSFEKCHFMRKMACKNKIENIKIFNCGLSEYRKILGHDPREIDNNTGGQNWTLEKNTINIINTSSKEAESNIFVPIDFLFVNNEIGNIGIYHIDVEGHEIEVLKGSRKIINKCKPTLFIERYTGIGMEKCKKREDSPDLFTEIDNLEYEFGGFLPNEDLIFYPT